MEYFTDKYLKTCKSEEPSTGGTEFGKDFICEFMKGKIPKNNASMARIESCVVKHANLIKKINFFPNADIPFFDIIFCVDTSGVVYGSEELEPWISPSSFNFSRLCVVRSGEKFENSRNIWRFEYIWGNKLYMLLMGRSINNFFSVKNPEYAIDDCFDVGRNMMYNAMHGKIPKNHGLIKSLLKLMHQKGNEMKIRFYPSSTPPYFEILSLGDSSIKPHTLEKYSKSFSIIQFITGSWDGPENWTYIATWRFMYIGCVNTSGDESICNKRVSIKTLFDN